MSVRNRQKGCMYGLAIGDALGAAIEFKMLGEFQPVTCYRGFGPFGLLPGQWTDDTSLALALADSLANGWDVKDQLEKYLSWFQTGKYSVNGMCFDIGNTTRQALDGFERNGTIWASDDQANSGNGSIMRLAPVAIKYHDSQHAINYLVDSSRTTHGSRQATSGCAALGMMLVELINGSSKEKALNIDFREMIELSPLIQKVVDGSYKQEKTFTGSGWVVESLESALWAFNTSNSFEETVLKAVNLGNDSDTTGAVAGQLAGAYWGYDKIPQNLIDGLACKDIIDKYLDPILTPE